MSKEKEWKKPKQCGLNSCKKEFIPSRQWQVYCTPLCAGRARNSARLEKVARDAARLAELEKLVGGKK